MLKIINHFIFMLFLLSMMHFTVGHGSSDSPQNQEESLVKAAIPEKASDTALPGSEIAAATAYADLEEKLPYPTEIKLISIEAMQWNDTSLGCPQEGFMYAQVITSGYLLIFEAGGKQYKYHTDTSNHVIPCENQ